MVRWRMGAETNDVVDKVEDLLEVCLRLSIPKNPLLLLIGSAKNLSFGFLNCRLLDMMILMISEAWLLMVSLLPLVIHKAEQVFTSLFV